jgi:hypothetical protein
MDGHDSHATAVSSKAQGTGYIPIASGFWREIEKQEIKEISQ